MGKQIIAQLEGPFEPEDFKDRYEQALRELIRRKGRGERPVKALPPKESNVIDLMDALRKSLRGQSRSPEGKKRTRRVRS